jgi:hypothetical protein
MVRVCERKRAACVRRGMVVCCARKRVSCCEMKTVLDVRERVVHEWKSVVCVRGGEWWV